MPRTLSAPLEQVRSQLEAASGRAQQLVAGLPSSELLGRRPQPDSWSIAECLAHLTLTSDAYLPLLRQAIARGRTDNLLDTGREFHMEFTSRLLAWWLEPPYRLKSKTGPAFVPGLNDCANALPHFLGRQQQLAALLTEADGLALDRIKIASPFAAHVRYNVYSAFQLIAVHERRHLWQAEQAARRLECG